MTVGNRLLMQEAGVGLPAMLERLVEPLVGMQLCGGRRWCAAMPVRTGLGNARASACATGPCLRHGHLLALPLPRGKPPGGTRLPALATAHSSPSLHTPYQSLYWSPPPFALLQRQEESGHTCVLVAVCGVLVAAIAIADPLKPEAVAVVAALQGLVGGGCPAAQCTLFL